MRAFSLIELIFVIVIMGILTFMGLQFIPNETLTADTQILKQKIFQKKSNALGYRYVGEQNSTCITFTKEWLNSDENSSNENVAKRYEFKFDSINVNGLNNGNTICFDYLGRPFDGDVEKNLTNLLHNEVNVTLSYRNKDENFTIYPISGCVK